MQTTYHASWLMLLCIPYSLCRPQRKHKIELTLMTGCGRGFCPLQISPIFLVMNVSSKGRRLRRLLQVSTNLLK